MNEPDVLRLPKRLFHGGYFHLPLKLLGDSEAGPVLRFPEGQLSDPGLQRFVFEEFHQSGFEARERAVLAHFLSDDAIFIDIGAHFGLYPLVLCERFPGILCVAIEPSPDNFSILVENVALAGIRSRVQCLECALGRGTGSGRLRLNSSMGHHLVTQVSGAGSPEIEVEVRKLDSLLSGLQADAFAHRPVWLKIDTEGRELDVLSGGRELLVSGRVAGVLWEYRIGVEQNPRKAEILSLLEECGFSSREITDGNILSLRCADHFREIEDI
ncbi:FkbM family methyltransferase [Nisaea sediminum]|uniref:FkbM family methyltransferase n=1 Tax=Nisaea sediminum TaxID=2775867 RepID=UPI0018696763|nr:FkbM family methyltransferase [Nisaea sediminum]